MPREVYVAVALEHLPLLDAQRRACERFDLDPRSELHVTLGYLGDVEAETLARLACDLAPLAREPLERLALTGTGGVYRTDPASLAPITDATTPADVAGKSRVVWWAVQQSDALRRCRRALLDAATRLGLDTRFLTGEYHPHVTIGSASGPEVTDPRPWDAHGIAKGPTLGRVFCPDAVAAEKLHVTRTDLHPQSQHLLRDYAVPPGVVVWLTGRPASGKSTLARILRNRLAAEGRASVLLDSDEVRLHGYPDLGYSAEDRTRFYDGLVGLAGLFAGQGLVVLVPATAQFAHLREAARRRLPRFVLVYVATSLAECAERDPKGLHRAGHVGTYEEPADPDVTVSGALDATGIERILDRIRAFQ